MIMTTNCHSSCNSALKILVLACSIALATGMTLKDCKGYKLKYEIGLKTRVQGSIQRVCKGTVEGGKLSLTQHCNTGGDCPVWQRWQADIAEKQALAADAKDKKQLKKKFEAARRDSQQPKNAALSLAAAMAQIGTKMKKDRRKIHVFGTRRRLDSTDEFLKKMNASIAESAAKTKLANAEAKKLRDAAESYSQNALAGFRDIINAGKLLKNPDAPGLSATEKARAYAILNANNRRRLYASHNPVFRNFVKESNFI